VSYDTKEVIEMKLDWLMSRGLGGGMVWELSADRRDEGSIVGTIHERFGNLDRRENHLRFEGSKWENLRRGME
jgi:chitinase